MGTFRSHESHEKVSVTKLIKSSDTVYYGTIYK